MKIPFISFAAALMLASSLSAQAQVDSEIDQRSQAHEQRIKDLEDAKIMKQQALSTAKEIREEAALQQAVERFAKKRRLLIERTGTFQYKLRGSGWLCVANDDGDCLSMDCWNPENDAYQYPLNIHGFQACTDRVLKNNQILK